MEGPEAPARNFDREFDSLRVSQKVLTAINKFAPSYSQNK
jgi:hypothetical protein